MCCYTGRRTTKVTVPGAEHPWPIYLLASAVSLLVFVKVTKVLQRPPQGLVKGHYRLVPKVPLGSEAAEVVVCACQCHCGGGEGGLDGHQRLQ